MPKLIMDKPKENLKHAELELLEAIFGGQSRVAEVLRVDRSLITKWHKGERPGSENAVKMAGLTYVMSKLTTYFHQETAVKWLEGNNAHLGNQRPIDLLKENRFAEVDMAIDQTLAGSYA